MMKSGVPDNIIARATKCKVEYGWLNNYENCPRCRVKDTDGKDILFSDNHGSPDCPYGVLFGDKGICRCPVHYWLNTHPDN